MTAGEDIGTIGENVTTSMMTIGETATVTARSGIERRIGTVIVIDAVAIERTRTSTMTRTGPRLSSITVMAAMATIGLTESGSDAGLPFGVLGRLIYPAILSLHLRVAFGVFWSFCSLCTWFTFGTGQIANGIMAELRAWSIGSTSTCHPCDAL